MVKEIVEYNSSQYAEEQKICSVLMDEINSNLSQAESKIWHGNPVWFIDGNPIVGYSKLKGCIQLLFWSGQSFDEKDFNPVGRHKAAEVRYTDVSQINTAYLNRWLNKSKEIQWDYKNIVKRKGVLERLK